MTKNNIWCFIASSSLSTKLDIVSKVVYCLLSQTHHEILHSQPCTIILYIPEPLWVFTVVFPSICSLTTITPAHTYMHKSAVRENEARIKCESKRLLERGRGERKEFSWYFLIALPECPKEFNKYDVSKSLNFWLQGSTALPSSLRRPPFLSHSLSLC